MKIGIIGYGHMGSALARGILRKNLGELWIGNPHKVKLNASPSESKKYHWTPDNREVVKKTQVVILAVKPKLVEPVLQSISGLLKPTQLLISIAAGIPLKKLTRFSKNHKKIIRAMPNLAAEVGESMSVWMASKGLSKKEKTLAQKILNSFGKNIEVEDEKQIDMATAISGGGPAYTAAFLECMARTAEKVGFTKDQARLMAIEVVDGALDYIKETGADFSRLKKAVQTKDGTTEAGFKILKKKQWQKTLEKAFDAGYKKARKMAR